MATWPRVLTHEWSHWRVRFKHLSDLYYVIRCCTSFMPPDSSSPRVYPRKVSWSGPWPGTLGIRKRAWTKPGVTSYVEPEDVKYFLWIGCEIFLTRDLFYGNYSEKPRETQILKITFSDINFSFNSSFASSIM